MAFVSFIWPSGDVLTVDPEIDPVNDSLARVRFVLDESEWREESFSVTSSRSNHTKVWFLTFRNYIYRVDRIRRVNYISYINVKLSS